jgi:hypothetical protein
VRQSHIFFLPSLPRGLNNGCGQYTSPIRRSTYGSFGVDAPVLQGGTINRVVGPIPDRLIGSWTCKGVCCDHGTPITTGAIVLASTGLCCCISNHAFQASCYAFSWCCYFCYSASKRCASRSCASFLCCVCQVCQVFCLRVSSQDCKVGCC